MSSSKWVIATIGATLLGAAVGYGWATLGKRLGNPMPAAPIAASTPEKGSRKVLYWHDPMKPEVKFDKPGKSPLMDMQLVPVYADEGAEQGGIAVSASTQQGLGIRIGHVEKAVIAPRAPAVGSVIYDEHKLALVQARVGGYVSRLYVRATLDRVRRGQILAEITCPGWIEAQGEYVALLVSQPSSPESLRAAARHRLVVLGIPDAAISELDKTRAVSAATALYAPIDGVVTELGLRDGATFSEGAVLFRINGIATVWVDAQAPEAQARSVRPGAKVEVRATAWPGEVFKGRVQSILPQIDPTTRTVSIRIAIDNLAGKLSAGMFVETTISGTPGAPQLWVPSEAVITTGERNVVIVKRDDGAFDVANVTTGTDVQGKTAILSGLSEGQAVVLSGQFLIDSEASLKSAVTRLSTSPNVTTGSTP